MSDELKSLYTIGHSNHSTESFIETLRRYEVSTVVDVRSRARSRTEPQFNHDRIGTALVSAGLNYRFIDYRLDHFGLFHVEIHDRSEQEFFDNTLGGFPKEDSLYADGLPRSRSLRQLEPAVRDPFYERIMGRPWFQSGAEKLLEMLRGGERVALLCQCKEPELCHGRNLVAKYVQRVAPDLSIGYIKFDGSLL